MSPVPSPRDVTLYVLDLKGCFLSLLLNWDSVGRFRNNWSKSFQSLRGEGKKDFSKEHNLEKGISKFSLSLKL